MVSNSMVDVVIQVNNNTGDGLPGWPLTLLNNMHDWSTPLVTGNVAEMGCWIRIDIFKEPKDLGSTLSLSKLAPEKDDIT